jgi:hypothetical protein
MNYELCGTLVVVVALRSGAQIHTLPIPFGYERDAGAKAEYSLPFYRPYSVLRTYKYSFRRAAATVQEKYGVNLAG